jgi:hypothetical protein
MSKLATHIRIIRTLANEMISHFRVDEIVNLRVVQVQCVWSGRAYPTLSEFGAPKTGLLLGFLFGFGPLSSYVPPLEAGWLFILRGLLWHERLQVPCPQEAEVNYGNHSRH